MRRWLVSALLRVYPAAWRAEYGPELRDLLLAQRLRLVTVADVVRSAARLRLRATEPWVLLGAPFAFITTCTVVAMILAPPPYRDLHGWSAWVLLLGNVTLASGCGLWTVLRSGGTLPHAALQTAKMALLISAPHFVVYTLVIGGALGVVFVGPGETPTTAAEHGFAIALYRAPGPGLPADVTMVGRFFGTSFAILGCGILGAAGGLLARLIAGRLESATEPSGSVCRGAGASNRGEMSPARRGRNEPNAGDRKMSKTTVGVLATVVAVLLAAALLRPQETPAPAHEIVGSWSGTLASPGGVPLRLVFHVQRDPAGALLATLDSPDQGAVGIPVSRAVATGDRVKLTVAAVRGTFVGAWSADGTQIDGVWQQRGGSRSLVLTPGTVESPSRPQEPEPPFPYDADDVRFPNREARIELAGTLTLPRSPGPHPAAVLISGSGPQGRDEALLGHRPFLVLADHLTRQGIAVLRFDDRGVGESGGLFPPATSEDFATDVQAAVDYLTARGEIDPERIGLVGHSEGGLIAPMVAARSPDVAFIVLLASPGTLGIEVMQRQTELMMRASGASDRAVRVLLEMQSTLHEIVVEASRNGLPHHFHGRAAPRMREVMLTALGSLSEQERMALGAGDTEVAIAETIRRWTSPWFRFFLAYDPGPTLERVAVPVLALNGDKDLQVWPEQNLPLIEAALRRAGNGDVTTRTLPNLNHLFQTAATGTAAEYGRIEETFAPVALSAISEWILERVGPAEGP